MTALGRVVVVGASAAGLSAAETLRREGWAGELTIVGDEVHQPYDRPPLSKQILRGTWEPERSALRRPDALAGLAATWRLGVRAVSLDPQGEIGLADGTVLPFDRVVVATGLRPRRLLGTDGIVGVHTLRTLDDALALRGRLVPGASLVVVGAGPLGAEAAAVAAELGVRVALVDPLPAPMHAAFGPTVAGRLLRTHVDHGVDVRCGRTVAEVRASGGHVAQVVLDDGAVLDADAVLVAVGSTPATDWLAGSGLSLTDGVDGDEFLQAAPRVVVAGDVASWRTPDGTRRRVEHRMNAGEQGAAAARSLLGQRVAFDPVPYFWSDQFDVKLQAYGDTAGADEIEIVDGDPAEGPFAALYGRAGRVTGAVSWNLPRRIRELRQVVVEGAQWPARAGGR